MIEKVSTANYCDPSCSRARGQDTLSKMAAFRSGEYSLRTGTTGPSTNVPISRFLVSHGYIPNSTTRSASRGNEDAERIISPSTPESAGNSLDFSFNSPLMAPMADMDGSSDSIPQDFGKRESSAPVQSSHDRTINVNTPRRAQSHQHSKPVLSSHSPAPGVAFHAQRPMAPMTPATTSSGHEILPSIEQEGHDDEIAALRLEVAHMHNMFQDVIISKVNRNIADNQEHQDLPLNMVNDGTKVGNLEQRFDQMEAMMQNLHHRLLPKVMDRIEILEKVVKDLNFEARDGCASKVTKMKEVFDCLKEALIRMDNLL